MAHSMAATEIDENDPSVCPTFLHREATYRSRLSANGKQRLSPRSLLLTCIQLVEDYNCKALPDVAPEDYAKLIIPALNVRHPRDQTFLTQVLYGCCRYKKLLDILTQNLFLCKLPNIQCVDETLYAILGYLVLLRLEELTFVNFRKFVLSQHPQKLLPFIEFIFSPEDLGNYCKPEWVKLYDETYVDAIISGITSWKTQAQELRNRVKDKILLVEKRKKKQSTSCKPFNLTISRKLHLQVVDEDDKLPVKAKKKLFRAKPIPNWKEGPTPTQKALEAKCRQSREKRAKFYADPRNQPFHLHVLERPSKFDAVKQQIEHARMQETKYIAPKARPCPEVPATEVKLTIAAVLREHALYEKQLQVERQRLEHVEAELRGDCEYKSWKEEMRCKDRLLEDADKKLKKAAVDASDEAAIQAKDAKLQENREIAKKTKEESHKYEALREELHVNLMLFNRLRKENIMEGKKAAKIAVERVAESKRGRAREIQAEVTKLVATCADEHAAELAKKKDIIRQLRSVVEHAESPPRMTRKFDPDRTAGHGLLAEMTMKELQERLGLVRAAIREEEECRRSRIHASKNERNKQIREKSEFVKRMREVVRARRESATAQPPTS